MNFQEALKQINLGKKVRLPNWSPESFIMRNEYGKIVCHTGKNAYFMDTHFERADWELYKEFKEIELDQVRKWMLAVLFSDKRFKKVRITFKDNSIQEIEKVIE